MKFALAVAAAALGLFLLFVSGLTLWVIFSQIAGGTDREGTNIYYTPLSLLIGASGVALFIPIYRLARRGAR